MVALMCWPGGGALEVVSLTGKVTSVKIYGNKAEVTREFIFEDYEEDSYVTIRLDGLPTQLEDKSVRVRGTGRAEIIESTVASRALPRDAQPDFIRQLTFLEQVASHISGAVDSSRATIQRAKAQKEYVESYTRASIDPGKRKTGDGNTAPAMISTAAMTEILSFQESVTVDMDRKIAVASQDLAENIAHLSTVQGRIDALKNKGIYTPLMVNGQLYCPPLLDCVAPLLMATRSWLPTSSSKSVEVRLLTARGTGGVKRPLTLSVTYLTGPARWYPEYDIRLEGDSGDMARQCLIEVDYYAAVEQQTEEVNFEEVHLPQSSLTTAYYIRYGKMFK